MRLKSLFGTDSKTIDGTVKSVMTEIDEGDDVHRMIEVIDHKCEDTKIDQKQVVQALRSRSDEIDQRFEEIEQKGPREWIRRNLSSDMSEYQRSLIVVLDELVTLDVLSEETREEIERDVNAGNVLQATERLMRHPEYQRGLLEGEVTSNHSQNLLEIMDAIENDEIEDPGLIDVLGDYDQNMENNNEEKKKNEMSPEEMAAELGADTDVLEKYADVTGKTVDECAQEWMRENADMPTQSEQMDEKLDQKMIQEIEDVVVDAMQRPEAIEAIVDEVESDVDQKMGEAQTGVPANAPVEEAKTVGEAGGLLTGDDE